LRLIQSLFEGGQIASGGDLLGACLQPAVSQHEDRFSGTYVTSQFPTYELNEVYRDFIPHINEIAPETVVNALKAALLHTLAAELTSDKVERIDVSSFWLDAIGYEDEYQPQDYKHVLIETLRICLLHWLTCRDDQGIAYIKQLNFTKSHVLRRLAVYIMAKHADLFRDEIATKLIDTDFIDGEGMHYEVFALLRNGFAILQPEQQQDVLLAILEGPSQERLHSHMTVRSLFGEVDEDLYKRIWVRDRLWPIRDHLAEGHTEFLTKLCQLDGEPAVSAYTPVQISGFTKCGADLSPIRAEEWEEKLIGLFLDFVDGWVPSERHPYHQNEPTMNGLTITIRQMVHKHPGKFLDATAEIIARSLNSAYLAAIIEALTECIRAGTILDWSALVQLLTYIVEAELSEPPNPEAERVADSNECRYFVARLLIEALEINAITSPHIESVRQTTMALLRLSNPSFKVEVKSPPSSTTRSPQIYRPEALRALILTLSIQKCINQISIIPADSVEILEDCLILGPDNNTSVLEVFGACINKLWGIDPQWTASHIRTIFPVDTSSEGQKAFLNVFSAYLVEAGVWERTFSSLKFAYKRAFDLLGSKKQDDGRHLDKLRQLALHLLWALEKHWDQFEMGHSGDENHLVNLLFASSYPALSRELSWGMNEVLLNASSIVAKGELWAIFRPVVTWRLRQLKNSGSLAIFDDEVSNYSLIPATLSEVETLSNLMPLIEYMLPHLARNSRPFFVHRLMQYLANMSTVEPLLVIRCCRTLCDLSMANGNGGRWYEKDTLSKILINVACYLEEPRSEVIALINQMAANGDLSFRDLYDQFTTRNG
jgi:hypothetical protein